MLLIVAALIKQMSRRQHSTEGMTLLENVIQPCIIYSEPLFYQLFSMFPQQQQQQQHSKADFTVTPCWNHVLMCGRVNE